MTCEIYDGIVWLGEGLGIDDSRKALCSNPASHVYTYVVIPGKFKMCRVHFERFERHLARFAGETTPLQD